MGRVWVLDTETKGTGAEMVPLDSIVNKKRAPRQDEVFVNPRRTPREPKPEEPRAPLSFKIVDVVSQQVLADGAGTREALEVLDGVRSLVDVRIYLWRPQAEKWRLLTLAEQRRLWERRADR